MSLLLSVPYFLESLLQPISKDKNIILNQDIWICQCIKLYAKDKMKMSYLFSAISKLESERKIKYILMFIENNSSFEDFEKIPLTPTSWSSWGSIVPVYLSWINFFKLLLPNLISIKLIKHKRYIEQSINYYEKKIEDEEIKEVLKG